MEGKSMFISSCSRRQMARRRRAPRATVLRMQLMLALLVVAVGVAVLVVGHGGI